MLLKIIRVNSSGYETGTFQDSRSMRCILMFWLLYNHRTWWRHQMETFPRYWPFVRGIHRSPVNSPHKGQWRGALMSSLASINGWLNNREAGDLRRYRTHYDVIVMNFRKRGFDLIFWAKLLIVFPNDECQLYPVPYQDKEMMEDENMFLFLMYSLEEFIFSTCLWIKSHRW